MATTADYDGRNYPQTNFSNRINPTFSPRLNITRPERSNTAPADIPIPLTPSESSSSISTEPQTIYPLPKPLRPEDEGMVEVVFAGNLTHNFRSGVFQKNTSEFCVLTNRNLLRFKNTAKAIGVFSNLWRFGTESRVSTANVNIPSDAFMIDIASIISVMEIPGGSIRIDHLSLASKQSSPLILTPAESLDRWLNSLRESIRKFLPFMSTVVNRDRESAIERLQRHTDLPDKIEDMIIHRVTWRERRSNDGSVRETLFNVLLVIGKNNIYILPALLVDADYQRYVTRDRFGLLSIHSLVLENRDDTFRIEVRRRGAETKTLSLASSWCETIIQDIRRAIDTLTPFYPRRPYKLDVPFSVRHVKIMPFSDISKFEDRGFDKLLEAYCAAYNLDKRRFNYETAHVDSTTPFRKILLKPAKEVSEKSGPYNIYELLAFFRSMRNNTIFREILFKNVDLAEMEQWIPRTDDGWATNDEDLKVDMLSSELYSLIISNKNLRRIDLTKCNIGADSKGSDSKGSESALSTIGKAMLTGNVGLNSILIGYNKLLSGDFVKLIEGIKANRKAIKELSVAGCGLTMMQLGTILVTLTELKPEHLNLLDISDNHHLVSKEKFETLLRKAKHLKTLRFRRCDPLLDSATLFTTRLRVLDIGGTAISDIVKAVLCSYTQNSSFKHLEILCIDDCNLTGSYLADLFHMISLSTNRSLHINAGYNPIAKEQGALPKFCASIALSEGPASLSLSKTEWDDLSFREFLKVLVYNTVIRRLDLSDIRLPTEPSKDTANMFSAVFERNRTLEELNLKGEEDLTENSGFGKMIVQVFPGLKGNRTLKKLNVRNSGIGDMGAYQIAEVLKRNNTLQSLDIDENQITAEGFQYLIGGLQENHTVIEFSEPVNDLRFQIRRLSEEIKTSLQKEAELQFILANSTGADARKARQQLEHQSQIRVDAEKVRARLPNLVDELMKLIERNKKIYEQVELQTRSLPRPRRSSSSAASTDGTPTSTPSLSTLPMLSADFRSIPDSPMSVATNSVWTFSPNQSSSFGMPLPDVEEFRL